MGSPEDMTRFNSGNPAHCFVVCTHRRKYVLEASAESNSGANLGVGLFCHSLGHLCSCCTPRLRANDLRHSISFKFTAVLAKT